MFTVEEIEAVHSKITSGSEFPEYIDEIKKLGVISFETWVTDSHTVYFGKDNFQTQSNPKYETLTIESHCDGNQFSNFLKIHQQGETDYYTFCNHCAATGIEKWTVDLEKMTCTYFDKAGNEILTESIPSA